MRTYFNPFLFHLYSLSFCPFTGTKEKLAANKKFNGTQCSSTLASGCLGKCNIPLFQLSYSSLHIAKMSLVLHLWQQLAQFRNVRILNVVRCQPIGQVQQVLPVTSRWSDCASDDASRFHRFGQIEVRIRRVGCIEECSHAFRGRIFPVHVNDCPRICEQCSHHKSRDRVLSELDHSLSSLQIARTSAFLTKIERVQYG